MDTSASEPLSRNKKLGETVEVSTVDMTFTLLDELKDCQEMTLQKESLKRKLQLQKSGCTLSETYI